MEGSYQEEKTAAQINVVQALLGSEIRKAQCVNAVKIFEMNY